MKRNRLRISASRFRYFLHARHTHSETGTRRLGELLGTDGQRVRSLRSRGTFLTFEQVEQPEIARHVVETIEGEWEPDAPFFGHESLADVEQVAILSNGPDADQPWAVFPCADQEMRTPELLESAVTEKEAIRQHLIGGARLAWQSGEPYIEAAMEERNWQKRGQLRGGDAVLEHIEQWELRATVDKQQPGEEVGLVPEPDRVTEPPGPEAGRLETSFLVDQVIFQNFADRDSFQAWFVLQFDRQLLPVPENWRRFWMAVDIKRDG
jgi:hypothetical protein